MIGRYSKAMDPEAMDFCMFVHHETDKAICASDTGEQKDAKWFPRSQIEVICDPGSREAIISMPMWLAKEKGLV